MKCSFCGNMGRVDPVTKLCRTCYMEEKRYNLAIRAIVKGVDLFTVEGEPV